MALKKEIKTSEARILVLLSQVSDLNKYARAITSKLDIDYSYGLGILGRMVEKGWLKKIRSTKYAVYETTRIGKDLLSKAKKVI